MRPETIEARLPFAAYAKEARLPGAAHAQDARLPGASYAKPRVSPALAPYAKEARLLAAPYAKFPPFQSRGCASDGFFGSYAKDPELAARRAPNGGNFALGGG